jgi:arylsulfatase A-like enzyme
LTGGLLAGTVVGLIESAVVLATKQPVVGDPFIYFWASIAYGIIGLAMGIAFAILISIITGLKGSTINKARSFALPFVLVLIVQGIVIARFRLLRDVFEQRLKLLEPAGIGLHLGLIAGAVVLFVILYRLILITLIRRAPFAILGNFFGGLAVWGIILLITYGTWHTQSAGGEHRESRLQHPPAPEEEEATRPNILVIVVDTLRRDHLSCYGYRSISTPHMDALAYDGILFHNMITQSSWTKPSFASILSSAYPSTHQAIGKPDIFSDQNLTIPEVLYNEGYYTFGILNNVNVSEVFNFQQGFVDFTYLQPDFFFGANEAASKLNFYDLLRKVRETFLVKRKNVAHYYQDAAVVNDRVISFLESYDSPHPFFLFVHYMDPHDPFFEHPYNGVGYARVSNEHPPPSMAEVYRKAYDEEILYLDGKIGELRDYLIRNGLYDDLLVVFTADHGEEFYEHGGWWHGKTLYDEQIRVPLFVKLPDRQLQNIQTTLFARSLDIGPTIFHVTGIEIPEQFQGMSLIDSGRLVDRSVDIVFSEEDFEGNVLQAARSDSFKLILANPDNPRGLPPAQFFDVHTDPREMMDRYGSAEAEILEPLKETISRKSEYALSRAVSKETGDIDETTYDRLKALGYIEQ